MLVQDVLDLIKIKLSNLNISRDDSALMKMMHLGMVDLYNKFNLSIKSETLRINSDLTLYELRDSDVSMLLNLYDRTGRELRQSDVVDGRDWEYKMVNYRSFILRNPVDGLLYAVYKASPVRIAEAEDELDLPEAMIDALILYVAYIAHNALADNPLTNGNSRAIVNTLYEQYMAACNALEMLGYRVPLQAESLSVHLKGFV